MWNIIIDPIPQSTVYCPAFIARVRATRLLKGLRLLSLGAGGGGCRATGGGGPPLPAASAGVSSNLFLFLPPLRSGSPERPTLRSPGGLGDRRAARRFEKGLGLRSLVCWTDDLDRDREPLIDLDREFVIRLESPLSCLPLLLLLSLMLPSREPVCRPRFSGLDELMRRLVLRSRPRCRELTEARESTDTERLLRFPFPSLFWRGGGGERDRDRERFVEMVEIESADEDLLLLLLRLRPDVRPLSSSFFFRMSSATPFLRTRSLGTSVVSLGFRDGLSSCWVREGRDL